METEKTYIPPSSPPSPPPANPGSPPPPPSLSSSPAHEFSFTICLRPPSPLSSTTTAALKLTKSSSPSDFDLSPADEIFFHGQLLPLQVLSHPHPNISEKTEQNGSTNPAAATTGAQATGTASSSGQHDDKHRSFSFFSALRKRLRGSDDGEAEKQRNKKKMMSHVVRLWKKYSGMVEPLLFFKSSKEKREVRRSSYSFSGNSNPRDGGWRRRWQGQLSAPASMRTSPANSGLLVAPANVFSSSDESTMEELQNAIQAAIAHCKNSIAVKEENCC